MNAASPTQDEIYDGRKAFQRMVAFKTYKWSPSSFVFGLVIMGFLIYPEWQKAHYEMIVIWILLLGTGFGQYQLQKMRNIRDTAFLRSLRLKYGIEIYDELQKPPDSLYYYIFQKRYWPDQQRPAVVLP